jgi:hypothetical protein
VVFVTACAGIGASALFLVIDGHVPASVPPDAPPYSVADLGDALRAVDSRGVVDLAELKQRHARLGLFVKAMAATTPELQPEKFPTVESRIAFWLNAYTALTLLELLDTRSTRASALRRAFEGIPIGGQRLTRAAILRRALGDTGDARVVFALFTGEKGRGVLDGAPFEGETLGGQLDDAVRRFVRRKENVSIDGQTVRLSALFERHRAALLAALPSERQHLLQIVWAYLPDACDADRPGCFTRSELDRACGSRFDGCQLAFVPIDETLAVRN